MSLITKKQIREFEDLFGPEVLADQIGRQIGKTTRMALAALLEALNNPGGEIGIRDHHHTRNASVNLFRVMKQMAVDLGLDYMRFDDRKNTVMFDWVNPWNEVTRELFEQQKKAEE